MWSLEWSCSAVEWSGTASYRWLVSAWSLEWSGSAVELLVEW